MIKLHLDKKSNTTFLANDRPIIQTSASEPEWLSVYILSDYPDNRGKTITIFPNNSDDLFLIVHHRYFLHHVCKTEKENRPANHQKCVKAKFTIYSDQVFSRLIVFIPFSKYVFELSLI